MKTLKLYQIVCRKKIYTEVRETTDRQVWLLFFINILLHSIFSLQAFFSGGLPSYAVIRCSDKYYYLMQTVALFPISLQVYLVLSALIYLYLKNKTDKADYAETFKISILTLSSAVGLFFAIPCNVFYAIFGYKFAALVPLFITAATVIGLIKLFKYLEHYFEVKLRMGKFVIVAFFIFSYLIEALIIR